MRAMKMYTVLDNKEVKNTGLKKLNILFQVEVKHIRITLIQNNKTTFLVKQFYFDYFFYFTEVKMYAVTSTFTLTTFSTK